MARLVRRRTKADFMGRAPDITEAARPMPAANPSSIASAPVAARERLPVLRCENGVALGVKAEGL
jgi:hypothetical protein